MRVEPHGVGSILHVIKRGARGVDITRDAKDKERFVNLLFYANDSYSDPAGYRATAAIVPPERPDTWPERDPLVRVLAFTLLSNHFHLLLEETQDGGVAKFMQRLSGSMSAYFNTKYAERGSLFQGGYRGIVVDTQKHLQYLVFYILAKNVLDMYPGGVGAAVRDFDTAWSWAVGYPYASLRCQLAGLPIPAIEDTDGLIHSVIGDPGAYKQEVLELLEFHIAQKGKAFAPEMLEPW